MQLPDARVQLVREVRHEGGPAEGSRGHDDVVGLDRAVRCGDEVCIVVPSREPLRARAGLYRQAEARRIRLEVVGELVLAWRVPAWGWERHPVEPVGPGRGEQLQAVPLFAPAVADPALGGEYDAGAAQPLEVVC